jgi:hypothetical protein
MQEAMQKSRNIPISPPPLMGEGLGGGGHPPLNPLPSREGKIRQLKTCRGD